MREHMNLGEIKAANDNAEKSGTSFEQQAAALLALVKGGMPSEADMQNAVDELRTKYETAGQAGAAQEEVVAGMMDDKIVKMNENAGEAVEDTSQRILVIADRLLASVKSDDAAAFQTAAEELKAAVKEDQSAGDAADAAGAEVMKQAA